MSTQLLESVRVLGWSPVLHSLEKWTDEADSSPASPLRSQKIARALLSLTNLFLAEGSATTPVDPFKSLLFRSRWSSVLEVREGAFEAFALLVEHGVEWANVGESGMSWQRHVDRCARQGQYSPGQRVVTTCDAGSTDWTGDSRIYARWGDEGVVEGWADGHGLTYLVRHADGKAAWYEPRELRTNEMLLRVSTGVVAKHGEPAEHVCVIPLDDGAGRVEVESWPEGGLPHYMSATLEREQLKDFAADIIRVTGEDPCRVVALRRQCEELEATLSEIAFYSKALGNGSLTEQALAWEALSPHERRESIMKRIEYLADLADATRRRRGGPETKPGWLSFPRQIDVSDVPTEDLPRLLDRLCGINKRDALAFVESLRVGHSCLASSPIVIVRSQPNDLLAVLKDQWGLWLRAAKDRVRWDISVRI